MDVGSDLVYIHIYIYINTCIQSIYTFRTFISLKLRFGPRPAKELRGRVAAGCHCHKLRRICAKTGWGWGSMGLRL